MGVGQLFGGLRIRQTDPGRILDLQPETEMGKGDVLPFPRNLAIRD